MELILARATVAKLQISGLLALLMIMILILVPVSAGQETLITQNDTNTSSNQSNTNLNLLMDFSKIYQEPIKLEEPVQMQQVLTITNNGIDVAQISINLLDYPVEIEAVYLQEALSLSITNQGQEISTTTEIPLTILPGETQEYIITYTYLPVHKEVVCVDETLKDIIPEDAIVLTSDLTPDTIIQTSCTVKIYHDGNIHYYDISVPLDELPSGAIESIYYVQGDNYIDVDEEQVIRLIS